MACCGYTGLVRGSWEQESPEYNKFYTISQCDVSKASALSMQDFLTNFHWCCDSCSSTSYCGGTGNTGGSTSTPGGSGNTGGNGGGSTTMP